jgi:hypothetical protein
MQLVFDDLARTECSQAQSLNIRNVHKNVPFLYADFAFGHDKPIPFLSLKNFTTPRAMSVRNSQFTHCAASPPDVA